jgi:ribosomal protein S18 acetylase RimI-like enzyme
MVDQPSLTHLTWETSGDPARADVEAVHAGLDGFNRSAADLAAVRPLGCFARLSSGRCVGGAIARTWGGCCEITQLWVDEAHRARGLGSRLVRLVEDEARARGCSLVYLDTFSFQAPGFYRRLGYEVACAVEGFPDGITKFLMRKRLG